jgi:hypothetical protein
VRVNYISGYTPEEFRNAASSGSSEFGGIQTQGLNASGIWNAVLLTVMKSFIQITQLKKKELSGFTPGPLSSEKLQDYSYTVASGAASSSFFGGLAVNLAPEVEELLEPFKHFGLWGL